MTTSRLFLLPVFVCALASCRPVGSPKHDDGYDTSNPYGTATSDSTTPVNPPATPQAGNTANSETASYQPVNPVNPPANPTYSPAVYEDNSSAKPATGAKGKKPAAANTTSKSTAHATPIPAGATVHIVVAGDSLSKISRKYHVPVASIKAANHMTNDTVVLGKKLQIPAR